MFHCKEHKINYCLYHHIMCGCKRDTLQIIYRYSTKELDQMLKKIEEACVDIEYESEAEVEENEEEESSS